MNWWNSITLIEQVLYIISAIFSAFLFVDLFFMIKNLNKKYTETKELINYIFSFRSLCIFVAVGCWTTIIAFKALRRIIPAFVIGAVVGIIVFVVFAMCLRFVLKMEGLSDVELKTLIGSEGIVYSLIPPKGEGRGKVSVVVNDRMRVFQAIAYEDNKIQSGNDIKVIDALGNDLLLVESIKEVK